MSFPRYPKYKDSGVEWLGEVPAHWDVCALKRIVRLQSGESITADRIEEAGEYPVYGGNGLRGYTTAFTHEGHFALIGRQGALCGNINYATGRFWASEHAVVASPMGPVATTWLGEMLRSMDLNRYSVSAAQPGLSVDLVGRLATLLAPLTEQNAIAAFLDRETAKIDGLVGEQRRMMELLREKREAVISYAVTMGLNPDVAMKPSGVEWLGNVPAHWRVLPFRRLTTRVDVGIAEAATHAYAEDGVPMVRSTNIKEQFVDSEDLLFLTKEFASRLASKTIHSGDILTTRTGANLGVSAVVPPSLHLAHCFTLLVSTLISECEPRFYNAFINSKPGMAHFAMTAWGASQPNISVPIVKEMPCVQPPIAEQRAIAAFLDEETTRFDTLTTEATRAIDLLQERRTALISAAVTGQIDVRSIGEMQPA